MLNLTQTARTFLSLTVPVFIILIFGATAAANHATPSAATTSTPRVSPRLPLAPPSVDPYTVALYHFDSADGNSVPDAVGLHPGTLNGNAMLTAGLYGNALRVDGRGSYARIGNLGYLSAGTVEAYVDFSSACPYVSSYFSILSAGNDYGSGQYAARMFVDGMLMFQIGSAGWHHVDTGINPCRYLAGGNTGPYFYPTPVVWPYEKWRFHHLATTWGPRGIEFWVDGVLHGVSVDPLPPSNVYTHRCNPQMQLGSAIYPLCEIPTIGLVPGAYAGGFGNYTTWLIGCDPAGSCFNGRIDEVRISNIQRTFSPIYDPPPTPIASVTPTRTPTPTNPYPDFTVVGLSAPVTTSDYMTKTISVLVSNRGTQSFNRASQSGVQIGQQSGGRRTMPPLVRVPDNGGATNYFFYVDVFIDRPPSGRTDAGNCPALGGGTNWSWVYALGIGESVVVPVDCWVSPGEHTFFAQIDMCDDLSGNLCSPNFGFVLERNEDNNIYPLTNPVHSASPFEFLPAIWRR
ncbi:MAG: hypothetical protein HY868_05170 [Chloroflexi bacterium]|nr:hypothetical protein [Chloroflexota bacterium]